jgi:hypothetical protein
VVEIPAANFETHLATESVGGRSRPTATGQQSEERKGC